MTQTDILAKLKAEIKVELERCANEEIQKLVEKFTHKFECEMGKHKADLISAIINNIEIVVNNSPLTRETTFQINIKKE